MSTAHTPAKYKIEIHFNKNRTTSGPNTAAVSIFESGARLNGEGDELVYLCNERDKGLALGMPGVKDQQVIVALQLGQSATPPRRLFPGMIPPQPP